MVEGTINDLEPAYVSSDFCLLAAALMDDLSLDETTGVTAACDVNGGEWPEKRKKLVRTLEAAMARHDVRWIKAGNPSVDECLAVANSLNLPRSLVSQVERKIKATGLIPLPFYSWWKTEQKV
jgi:hypothetical protein